MIEKTKTFFLKNSQAFIGKESKITTKSKSISFTIICRREIRRKDYGSHD
jgi:hypothetical protein